MLRPTFVGLYAAPAVALAIVENPRLRAIQELVVL